MSFTHTRTQSVHELLMGIVCDTKPVNESNRVGTTDMRSNWASVGLYFGDESIKRDFAEKVRETTDAHRDESNPEPTFELL